MRLLLLVPLLALAACGSDPAIEVRTVPVPVPVPCVDENDLPAPTPESDLTGNARVDSAILKAENLDLRALIVPGCTAVEATAEPLLH